TSPAGIRPSHPSYKLDSCPNPLTVEVSTGVPGRASEPEGRTAGAFGRTRFSQDPGSLTPWGLAGLRWPRHGAAAGARHQTRLDTVAGAGGAPDRADERGAARAGGGARGHLLGPRRGVGPATRAVDDQGTPRPRLAGDGDPAVGRRTRPRRDYPRARPGARRGSQCTGRGWRGVRPGTDRAGTWCSRIALAAGA